MSEYIKSVSVPRYRYEDLYLQLAQAGSDLGYLGFEIYDTVDRSHKDSINIDIYFRERKTDKWAGQDNNSKGK